MKITLEQEHILPKEAENIRVTIEGTKLKILFEIEERQKEIKKYEKKENLEITPEEVKGTQEYIEKYFPIVRASTLSLEDNFLKHRPQTGNQRFQRKTCCRNKIWFIRF